MEEKKTCLYDRHVALGALMQPFGGFIMPIQYSTITDEHNAVRNHCGVFDVSHMGEVMVTGTDAQKFVNHIFTNDVSVLTPGKIAYGMMLYPNGGTVDDLLVYKVDDNEFFIVVNAANDDKDLDWIRQNAEGFDVMIDHCSDYYGQLAIQGPEAENVVETVLNIPCKELLFYTFKEIEHEGEQIIVSRTGYTGEDGFEVYASNELTCKFWDALMKSGKGKPCGLGCRDTLRFEVGLPLYGDELSADISPVMAGLSIFCKLDKDEFIGKEAIEKQKTEGFAKKLVGIELHDRAIPRHGYDVLKDGKVIGYVTTGYHTISTDKSVCMALIDREFSKLGTEVEVQIRKKVFTGTVVKKKFYDKHYKM
jgi:aminomethyltransferase